MGRLAQRSAVARSPALWARSGGFMHHCAHTSNSIALLVPRAFLSVGVGSRDGGPIGATVRFLRPKATRFQMLRKPSLQAFPGPEYRSSGCQFGRQPHLNRILSQEKWLIWVAFSGGQGQNRTADTKIFGLIPPLLRDTE
jgi:hypothetical protein